ncbi:MAG: alpha/beta hydrolase [Chloroflexi bacterium]|nr:alpha/beta hydrolase [Chloroflexota bacterium]
MVSEREFRESEKRLWASVRVTPTERRVRLAGIGVEVRVQEAGDGPPVLFLHGGPNAGTTWAHMVAGMREFRCLVVDRPGTGLSQALPRPLTPATLPPFGDAFAAEVLDALGIARALVVASSFGGYLALRGAAAHPSRIARMVQMACPAFAPGMKTPPFMRLMSLRLVRGLMGRMEPNVKTARSILRQIGHGASIDANRIPDLFFQWYVDLQKHTDTMRNDGDMIGNLITLLGAKRSLTLSDELLRSVQTPTLFYWGEDDAFGGEEVARNLARLVPNAQLEMVPKSGHLPWLDDPARAVRATVEFFASS